MGCVGLCYPTFAVSNVLGPKSIIVIYSFAWSYIYRTIEWMKLLATFQFHFDIPRVEVSHKQDLIFISIKK
jgi:hypothetical protein